MRADSGFWSYELLDRLDALRVRWSITIPLYGHVKAAIAAIPEADWTPIAYPQSGEAHVAETTLAAGERGNRRRMRLVVRRSRLTDAAQAALWPNWRYHTFTTNTTQDTVTADAYHRQHASIELAIRDLKNTTGLAHLPSGNFAANAAWGTCAALAHNLYRWINAHTTRRRRGQLTAARTIRNQLLALPGRLVNHSGRTILRLPARWPWAPTFHTTLTNIRNLPQLC